MPFIIDTEKVSKLVVELLARSIVLPATVSRVPNQDYQGTGGIVTIRVPQRRVHRTQASPGAAITYTPINEVPVTLSVAHWYDATQITDEDLTLSIEDLGRQVLLPMTAAVAEAGEEALAAVMNGLTAVTLTTSAAADDIIDTTTAHGFVAGDKVRFSGLAGGTGLVSGQAYYVIATSLAAQTFRVSATPGGAGINFTTDITAGKVAKFMTGAFATVATEADTKAAILAAREALTKNDVPAGGRFFAASPEIATRVLNIPELVKVNESGSPSALRDAVVGKLFGFNVVESSALDAGEAVAYHSSGFAFATLAPAIPNGAGRAFASEAQGIAVRTLFDFDASVLSDVAALSTFGGATLVDADRVVKLATS